MLGPRSLLGLSQRGLSIIMLIIFVFFGSACSYFDGKNESHKLSGTYQMQLILQGNKVPFLLDFSASDNTVIFKQSVEKIELKYEIKNLAQNHYVSIKMLHYPSEINLKVLNNKKLEGTWVRLDREDYVLKVSGELLSSNQVTTSQRQEFGDKMRDYLLLHTFPIEMIGKDNKKTHGVLNFNFDRFQKEIYSTIVTPTGDYRYLNPQFVENQDSLPQRIVLTGFDGIFSFYIDLHLKPNAQNNEQWIGKLFAGRDYQSKVLMNRNDSYELPRLETKIDVSKLKDIQLKNINGEKENIIDQGNNLESIQVIQIFGTWCPNCIDETKFFLEWKKKNPSKKVKFKIISFERERNNLKRLMLLKKFKDYHQVDYEIYDGGTTDEVNDVFRGMEGFGSFPTTFILDKNLNIRDISAGFSGQASGKYFEGFKLSFNRIIDKLLNE